MKVAPPTGERDPLTVPFYRWLLRLYPLALRRAHGAEMLALVAECRREAAGRREVRRLWGRLLIDAAVSVPREHVRALAAARPSVHPFTRSPSGDSAMLVFCQDLRHAVRSLFHRPFYSSLVTAMFVLGIAGNVVMLTLVDELLIRPLPYPEAERLVYVDETAPDWGGNFIAVDARSFRGWQEHNQTFESMAMVLPTNLNLSLPGGTEHIELARVTPQLGQVLGLRPILGRDLESGDDQPGGARVAVLSHKLWQQRFGGRPGVLDQVVHLDGEPYTIVGVLPANDYPRGAELWIPLQEAPAGHSGLAVGRLREGVTAEQALADLRRVHAGQVETHTASADVLPVVGPLRERYLKDDHRFTVPLLGAVGLVLLIACANIACLNLARATVRSREIGIRAALGAGRGRLLRQMLTESMLLAISGGVLGTLLALGGLQWLRVALADQLPFWVNLRFDGRILAFCVFACLGSGLLSGLLPALRTARQAIAGLLRQASLQLSADRGRRRVLSGLVIVEIALAMVLLVGAGLLFRAFAAVTLIDPGFRTEQVLTFQVTLPDAGYEDPMKRLGFFAALQEKLAALPGVSSASGVSLPPMIRDRHRGMRGIEVEEGGALDPQAQSPMVLLRAALPGYLDAMGVTLLSGRGFTAADGRDGEPVGIVNQTFVRTFWNLTAAEAVGKRMRFGAGGAWVTVIGVSHDVMHYGLEKQMHPGIYLPLTEMPEPTMAMVLHTESDPRALAAPARAAVAEVDAAVAPFEMRTMADFLQRSLRSRRLYSALLGLFAAVALLLAMGGTYGVVSYSVSQRAREFGLRMALGARRGQVRRLVLRQGVGLALSGVAIGALTALGLTRAVSSLMAGVSATDPRTYFGVALGLVGMALLANLVPAVRAAKAEPVNALREE